MCAYEEEKNDVVMFEKNGVFIWHNLKKEIVLFDIVHVFIDVCDFFFLGWRMMMDLGMTD